MRQLHMLAAMLLMAVPVFAASANGTGPFEIGFDDPRWVIDAAEHEVAEYLGQTALKIRGGAALLPDTDIENGIVEFDLAITPERGFAGLMFRWQDPVPARDQRGVLLAAVSLRGLRRAAYVSLQRVAARTRPAAGHETAPLICRGNNGYQTRDYRYLGTIGLFDTLALKVKGGDNELWIAVSEDFGGWGIMGRITDFEGVR